ncbi:pseudouridine synthase [Pelagibacterium halotolerans]|uniref:Pseudouridine synthase n=1 Tax=Pelagibacterium halotolerans (strain DSM 22347 / JCM 15775 / CGMCC 1.7692 / B2) TaxID=1082931 RepID=G4RB05_PELHB|nr:pseudouridine synthase [Pelagibacterium halotolerans]AEQ50514.1 ribosomal large subunit pseudouridine synthase B [Pelagibacterium halotolerans B2]SDZ88743.1 23S rRNA pseudouridine2605 synthase [Pelagibacterium halotolerans]
MSEKAPPPSGERLAKVIARAGVCSRRDAEAWITAGRIAVNGSPVKTPAFNVIESDTIAVDGKPLARKQATQLWLYHKPAGLMVTEKDPEGRATVFSEFEKLGLPRVLTVGRLDYNTEGLLLLTNDGGLKRTLELPATGWVRRYRARAFGSVTQEQLDTLANGTTVEGVDYGPIEAVLDSTSGSNVWITMSLREGKNREVRNVLGALGLEVNRLIRLSYGPFQLGDLPTGSVEKVKSRILQDQLGKRLAESAGADFDSPVAEEPNQPRRRSPQRESQPTERDRFGGLRKRPDFKRPERREEAPRTVHFDDGRPSQSFVPSGGDRKGKRDEGGFGDRPRRDSSGGKRFERGEKSFGERPQRSGGKPFNKGPRQTDSGSDRPFRKDADRPPRREGARGDRPFAKGPRREGVGGDRPFSKGPRRDGAGGGRPFAKGPRREGTAADRPFSKDPRREGAGADRPFSKGSGGQNRPGGKPFAKGPRRDAGNDRPVGPRQPRRDGKPSTGNRADRPRRPRPEEDK